MSSLNRAELIGRLTRDPEMRYTPSGQPVTSFSIATNRYASGPEGEKKEYTDYHNIVCWNIGRRNLAKVVAHDVQFLDTRGGGEGGGGGGGYERGPERAPGSRPATGGDEMPPMEESHAR